MRFPRPTLGLGVAVLILALMGAGVFYRIQGEGEEGTPSSEEAGERPGTSAPEAFATDIPIPVEGTEVVQDTLVIAVKAAGQAVATSATTIAAQVGGRIDRVFVEESQAVGRGAPLVQVDVEEYQLALDEARARLRRAQAEFQSMTLADERITDAAVREERQANARAKSGLDEADVGVRRAEMNLERTAVKAPFGGRVADLLVVPGQWVRQGDPLVTVADIDPIKVEVQVLETEVGYLSPGRTATVTFAAYPDLPFEGRILTINPLVDQDSRTARVTVSVPNPGGRILPGMYAQVSLDARRFPDRILVPRSAILERDRRTMLFVHTDGLAKWRYVTTGLQNDRLVEIVESPDTEMVQPGEVVLTDGHYTLIHDARVRLVESVTSEGGRPN